MLGYDWSWLVMVQLRSRVFGGVFGSWGEPGERSGLAGERSGAAGDHAGCKLCLHEAVPRRCRGGAEAL